MARIFQLSTYRDARVRAEQCQSDSETRERAKILMQEAANILSALSSNDKRVAWMVEDCVDLLEEREEELFTTTLSG